MASAICVTLSRISISGVFLSTTDNRFIISAKTHIVVPASHKLCAHNVCAKKSMESATVEANVADTKRRMSEVMLAAVRLPPAEVAGLHAMFPDKPLVTLYIQVAMNRWNNRICNRFLACPLFGTQRVYLGLHLCDRCRSTWYCSDACRNADRESHDQWCCNPHARPDEGPLKVTLMKVAPSSSPPPSSP